MNSPIILTPIVPLDESGDMDNTAPTPKGRSKGIAGRARFATGCAHGGTNEIPCPKFGDLPGGGKGVYQPGISKQFLVIIRVVLKPLFYCGLVYLAGYLLLGWFGGVLQFNGPVPKSVSSVPAISGHASPSSIPANSVGNNRVSPSVTPSATHIPKVRVTK